MKHSIKKTSDAGFAHLPFGSMEISLDCDQEHFEGNLLWIACAILPSEKVFDCNRPSIPLLDILEENGITVKCKERPTLTANEKEVLSQKRFLRNEKLATIRKQKEEV